MKVTEALAERTRELIEAALLQVTLARALRETAGNLRQENRDFRELMREKSLFRAARGIQST